MPKVPVQPPRKLFALLRYLGIDQNSLAAHLGVSHSLVSFWAHGKTPIPAKYHPAIDALIHKTFDASSEAWQQKYNDASVAARMLFAASEEDNEETDAVREAMATWNATLEAWGAATETYACLLEEARIEAQLLSGDLHRGLYQACRTVGIYGMRQPQRLTAAERDELGNACATVLAALRQLGRLESPALDAQMEQQRQVIEQKLREVG